MSYTTDRNEAQRRHWAILLTITLHLALAIGIYLSAENSAPQPAKTEATRP